MPRVCLTKPGTGGWWKGPAEYFPPIQVSVMEKRKSIPLDVNEGIYIRDTRTGHVRANVGKTVMLNEFEELWEKPLPPPR